MKIAVDFDDTLVPFVSVACNIWNNDNDIKLDPDECDHWGKNGSIWDNLIPIYDNPKVLYNQIVPQKSKDFINKLQNDGHEIYIVTAVAPKNMGIRAEQILENFNNIDESHIIMGSHKYLMKFDILLDDAPHNILDSITMTEYPILYRKPWNKNISGILSCNDLDEAYNIICQINSNKVKHIIKEPHIIALIGPSGCGKHDYIKSHPEFINIESLSTNPFSNYISEKEFKEKMKNNEFAETTYYAGYRYGTLKKVIDENLSKSNVIINIDICGAMALKMKYPTKIVYLNRKKELLIRNIIRRNISEDEKTYRLISIDNERRNKKLCDEVIENN